jgi:hypothetical protein
VQSIDPHKALFDLTPVTITVTAGGQRVEWHTSIHEVRTDCTLWRRMHLADWNAIPETLQREGLDNMLGSNSQFGPTIAASARHTTVLDRFTSRPCSGVSSGSFAI